MKRSARVLLLMLGLISGCAGAPEEAAVRWSEQDPVVHPVPPTMVPEVGRLAVRTPESGATHRPGSDTNETWHRGYAIFDPTGRLVYTCSGHADEFDGLALQPGRYILVAAVDSRAFQRELRTVQFVIEVGQDTVIDFTRMP